MKIGIVMNTSAGSIKGGDNSIKNLKKIFDILNVEIEIIEIDGRLNDKIRVLIYQGIDVLVAAGGDGTVSAVASEISGNKIPLGILPLGTLNHLAKDLNIPLDIEEAAKIIVQKKLLKIDIGEVNGNFFINNSSIGIYPKMVKHREKEKDKFSIFPTGKAAKWLAMIRAFIKIFSRFPLLHVKISHEGKIINCITPFVFVGNNEYEIDLFNMGTRTRITDGKLSLYYPVVNDRLSTFKFFYLAMINRLKQEQYFNIEFVTELTIESRKRILEVSTDGEVLHLSPPLIYKIHASDLTVIVP